MSKRDVAVKFSADIKEFKAGIANVNKDISTLSAELRLNAVQLKGNAGDANLLKERQSLLSTELQKSHEKARLQNEILQKAKAIYGEDSNAVKEYERKLADAQSKEESIRQQLVECNKEIKNQKDILGKTGEALDSFGSKATNTGNVMTATVTTSIIAAGTASGKMAVDFEDNIANINTLLDDDSHLEGYKNKITDVSNDTGMALETVSSGMYQTISSIGDAGEETENIFSTMATAAKAGGAEVSDSVALISSGMKGYNSVNDETARKISDLAFQTAKLGVTTFPEMAKSMQPLFPLANSLNLSYEDLFGSMATLTGVTGNTAEVSTQLKAVFSNMMKPTKDMQELIEKYGYSSGQAMIESEGFAGMLKIVQEETGGSSDKMAKLFSSTEAMTAMTALTGSQFDTFNDKLKQMGDAAGSTETAYGKLETKGNKLRKTVNEVKNTATELGGTLLEVLEPAIESGAEKVEGFANWFGQLDSDQKETIVTIAGVVAAVGPALIVIGKVSTGLGAVCNLMNMVRTAMVAKSAATAADAVITQGATVATAGATVAQTGLNTALWACPVVWIVAAIAAVVAIVVVLWNKCDGFREGVLKLWDGMKEGFAKVSEGFTKAKDVVCGALDGIKGYAKSKLDETKKIYEEHGGGVAGVVAAGMNVITMKYQVGYDAINKLTGGKLDVMKNTAKEKINGVKDAFKSTVDKIKSLLDFEWKWPHIKSPSITVTYSKEGNLAKAAELLGFEGMPKFSIKWNASGAILTKPTIFGFAGGKWQGGGEAGHEAVIPIEKLKGYIADEMEKFVKYIPNIDYEKLGNAVADAIEKRPVKIMYNRREIGRMVGV